MLTAVRLLLTPVTVYVEYNTPGFPPDPFGFTKEDRLYWSQIGMNYLLNDAGVNYVGDLRFADGKPVYNERELRHYEDAKRVLKQALALWIGALAALIALGIWGWLGGWWELFRRGLRRGAWLTSDLDSSRFGAGAGGIPGLLRGFPRGALPGGHLDVRVERYVYPPVPGALLEGCVYLRGGADAHPGSGIGFVAAQTEIRLIGKISENEVQAAHSAT